MESASSLSGRATAVGRGKKMRAAVLSATLAELTAAGFANLTIEGVAHRAGVHKTTIYRNWQDRDSLVVDALIGQFALDIPIPDTGAIESDLCELARSLVATMTSEAGRALLAAMLSDAVRIPELAAIKHALFDDRFRRAEPVVVRAIERGEIPVGTDPRELLKTLIAPIYFQLLFIGEPVDETTADRAAQVALAAAQAHALLPPRTESTARQV